MALSEYCYCIRAFCPTQSPSTLSLWDAPLRTTPSGPLYNLLAGMGSGNPEEPGDAIHRPPARRSGQEPVLFISAWCPGTAHLSPRLNKWGLPKMNKRLMSAWNWDFLNVLPLLLWTLSVTELSSVVIKCTDVYQNTSNVRDFLFPLHFAVLQLK